MSLRKLPMLIHLSRDIRSIRIIKQLDPPSLIDATQAHRRVDVPLRARVVSVIRGVEEVADAGLAVTVAEEVVERGVGAEVLCDADDEGRRDGGEGYVWGGFGGW